MRKRWELSPSHLVIVSFAVLIAVGTVFLALPFSAQGQPLNWVDALFLATSAVCVTGLTPVDPGSTLSSFGQVVLLLLIQIGGLGYMSLSALVALFLRRRLSVTERLTLEVMWGELVEVWRLLRYAVLFTFGVEVVGALLLFLAFHRYDFSPVVRAWFAVFHSVSAFCNAGLDVFGLVGQERGWAGSLQPFATDPLVVLTIAVLLMLGGIGFPVVTEIADHLRRRRVRWSIHARAVFLVNSIMWFGGMGLLWLFEHGNPNTFGNQPLAMQWLSAFFLSATARTAGFSAVPIDALSAASLWLLCLWMFVGASPAGTGGGIKTTTVAVLAATAFSSLRGREQTVLFKRSIPPDQFQKAALIAVVGANLVGTVTLLLCATEARLLEQDAPYGALSLLFEAVSAFGTVGLSTGVTPRLSPWGKLILVATMFIGRIGLLTLLVAIAGKRVEPARYPSEGVLVG